MVVFKLGFAALVASGLTLASPANADEAASPATAKPGIATSKSDKPKRICRAGERTGSRLARPICKTQEQWNSADDSSKLELLDQGFKQNTGNGAT